jgi:hypothetical protein
MTECRCPACSPDDPAPTYTREFMRQCLVRTIAGRSPAAIKAFLAAWAEKRPGDKIRDEIVREYKRLHDK